ncbi:hypothetical protein K3495_g7103 [Podosphaera aphanis]|nr:hypothetical protein K3495_g7103 [Podosphaera aphanis]
MQISTKSLTEAYKVVRWHYAASRYQSPPLRHEESSEVIHDPQEKARLLHRALLWRHLEAEDIPPETPAVPQRNILRQLISNAEAFKATTQVTSTSPGEDEPGQFWATESPISSTVVSNSEFTLTLSRVSL